MFGSKDSRAQAASAADGGRDARPATTPSAARRSHIAEGMEVKGDISGDIDLLLEGRLEGNLRCRAVTVGKTGEVIGKISAQEATIDGTVKGDIEAKAVRLNVTARMTGDVRHEVIEVAAGARIEGHYSRLDTSVKPKPAAAPAKGMTDPPPKTPAEGPKDSKPKLDPSNPDTGKETGEVVALDGNAKAS
jgi:cytoskeletal protein CcmA (bactofilin family)